MTELSGDRRYTADDLVSAAGDVGLAATPRLVRDWASIGLLDHPVRRGRGRGRGIVATWSENQMRLFLVLLDHRQRGDRVGPLCNLVVSLWLVWGDDYVPTRQARLALLTWVRAARNPSWPSARRSSADVTAKLAHPDARRGVRTRFRETLAMQQAAGFDRDHFASAARDALDPLRTGKPRGPEGAQLSPENYTDLVESRFAITGKVRKISDQDFLDARTIYQLTKQRYELERLQFAEDPEMGQLFQPTSFNDEVNTTCADLLTILGLQETHGKLEL